MSLSANAKDIKCCCKHVDARACFLARHPECNRRSDDTMSMYDVAIDEECDCCCHSEPFDDPPDCCDDYYH